MGFQSLAHHSPVPIYDLHAVPIRVEAGWAYTAERMWSQLISRVRADPEDLCMEFR